jgi:hypothetical protein
MFAHCSTLLHYTLRTAVTGRVKLLDEAGCIDRQRDG